MADKFPNIKFEDEPINGSMLEGNYHLRKSTPSPHSFQQDIQWHYISTDGLPKVDSEKAKVFLICYRAELAETVTWGGFTDKIPSGKFIDLCTIALFQNHEDKEGFAYTPANKFFWGPDIFENVYAWAYLPNAIPFK